MSYYNIKCKSKEAQIGQKIYMNALHPRRGFREDQLDIFDEDIWLEIFEDIGQHALEAVGGNL